MALSGLDGSAIVGNKDYAFGCDAQGDKCGRRFA
jgi:hypothetical protein